MKEGYKIVYKDVVDEPRSLEEMLKHTPGSRRVPVLVEAGQVTIGFGGT